MNREDYDILIELGETLVQLEQGSGANTPEPRVNSSSILRRIAEFARECERSELKGRSRKLKSNALLLEVLQALDRLK